VSQSLEFDAPAALNPKKISFWKNPAAWLRERNLSKGYWTFFTAAFFFDFGFAVYVFLFNLYLLDLHFNEHAIGLIGGALTLGSLAGTLPAGLLARKIGIRPLLIVCFIAAPILFAARALVIREPAQIGLAFFAGLAMCLWAVSFLPAIAEVTTEENRTAGFSLIASASIGTSALGGIVCGYLPRWLSRAGFVMQPVEVKRLILLASCAIAALGIFAVLRMQSSSPRSETPKETKRHSYWKVAPFLLRFLPSMALWTVVLASFTPFANVYLSRELHVPLLRIGLVFSVAQILQFCLGLLTPLLFRKLGIINGIVVTQLMTAAAIGCLAGTHNTSLAIALYLGFSAMQWMSSPGLYNLLMSRVPAEERSTAAAMTMFCNALLGSAATAAAGILFTRFGYPHVLFGIAALAVAAAMLFQLLVGATDRSSSAQPIEL
jgi:MFS family permease